MGMEYFPAFFGYRKSFAMLTNEQFGRVMRAALAYAEDGEIPDLSDLEALAFAVIRGDIDRAKVKYESIAQRNRVNGMKGGRPKSPENPVGYLGTQGNPENPVGPIQDKTKQDNTKQHNTKESISASADAKPARGKAKGSVFTPPTVEEVRTYCAEAGLDTINPEAFVDYYNANGWRVGSQAMKDWKATVRNWARRDKERGITAKAEAKPEKRGSFDTDEFMAAAFARTQREMNAMGITPDSGTEKQTAEPSVQTGVPKGWEGIF